MWQPDRRLLFVGTAVILTLAIPLSFAVRSTALSHSGWPRQPIRWPNHLGRRLSLRSFDTQVLMTINRKPIRSGQWVRSSLFGGLFFIRRSDLDQFMGEKHVIGPDVRLISPWHVVRALEDIPITSDGGQVYDEELERGFLYMAQTNADMPRWLEIYYLLPSDTLDTTLSKNGRLIHHAHDRPCPLMEQTPLGLHRIEPPPPAGRNVPFCR